MRYKRSWTIGLLCVAALAAIWTTSVPAATQVPADAKNFPRALESYKDAHEENIRAILVHRARQEPINLFATLIFLLAIVHTFLTGKFMAIAHRWEHAHQKKIKEGRADRQGPFIDPDWDKRDDPVPVWVTAVHMLFMAWTIVNAHHPELFIPGILFFVGFAKVTAPFQNRMDLKAPILVGFFLGGLVIHGGVQGWWIAPILSHLKEIPLMLGAAGLTAFNDNAAITYLSTLVPDLTESMKYSVVAGAVAGGGLTIIANAPNPAGVSILKPYFNDEVSPMGMLMGALIPTVIMLLLFIFL